MLRAVEVIALAIQMSQPALTAEQATSYAQVLHEEAVVHDFDPLTGVAIIATESGFHPSAVSKNGEDLGLAQIRARYVGACVGTQDPVRKPTAACQREKARLLDPAENIRVMADLITRNRDFCKKKVGSTQFHRWLASYQGRNYPKKKVWCKAGEGTWKVIRLRGNLIRDLSRAGKLTVKR
ncbi:MAG: hypothetical protein RJA70_941 [Pseudomonadota bacterium]|jgi:hypothetical protein